MKRKIVGATVLILRHRRRTGRGRCPGRADHGIPGARPRDHPPGGGPRLSRSRRRKGHAGGCPALHGQGRFRLHAARLPNLTLDLNGAIGFKRLTVEAAKASGYASTGTARPAEPAPESADGKLFANPAFTNALTGPGDTAFNDHGGRHGNLVRRMPRRGHDTDLRQRGKLHACHRHRLQLVFPGQPCLPRATQESTRPVTEWTACMKETPYASFCEPGPGRRCR